MFKGFGCIFDFFAVPLIIHSVGPFPSFLTLSGFKWSLWSTGGVFCKFTTPGRLFAVLTRSRGACARSFLDAYFLLSFMGWLELPKIITLF
jgi:hypothetical protein